MPEPAGTFAFGKKQESESNQERRTLLAALVETRRLLQHAYAGFNEASDPDLVESFVFEINALQSRYSYLLRRIKEGEGAEIK